MTGIKSRNNPVVKRARGLQRRKYREQEGRVLLEGVRLLEEALAAGVAIETVFYTPNLIEGIRGRDLLATCASRGAEIYPVSDSVLSSLAETESPQGVVAVALLPVWEGLPDVSKEGPFLLLDQVQDPGNMGTMIRTATAAGCQGVYCSPGTVDPYNGKVLRASMGSIFRLPVLQVEDFMQLLMTLKEMGHWLVAADVKGDCCYWDAAFRLPGGVVVGNEAWGVSPPVLELVDARIKIPLAPGVESLNAAVAAGIILYEWVRRRKGPN